MTDKDTVSLRDQFAMAALTPAQDEMLSYMCRVPGADVWERWDAKTCRELEPLGLVRIVKAKNAPANGAMRQPFFGVKITAAGRKAAMLSTRSRSGGE